MKSICKRGAVTGLALAMTLGRAAYAADPTPAVAVIPLAHSALLSIDATAADGGVALHIKHANNQIPIDGRDVKVSVDGKELPVTAEPEGTFLVATKDLEGDGERQLDITVAHDGIREILSGKLTLPKSGGAGSMLGSHKQIAWWVLNIAIVMIAVTAFSRRSEKKAKEEEAPPADED